MLHRKARRAYAVQARDRREIILDGDKVLAALTRLEQGQASLSASVEQIQADITTNRTEQTSLGTDLASLAAEQIKLRVEPSNFRTELTGSRTAMMSRFGRIEDRLTTIGEDLTVSMDSSGTALERMRSSRHEVDTLMTMVTTIHQQMMRMRTDIEALRNRSA